MNAAPQNLQQAREPFSAFVCDDETLELIRAVAGEIGWQVEQCNKGGLRNAIQSLSISSSPNILFVDVSESGDLISDINSLAEVCEPGTIVIASGKVNDVRLYRDLLSSGIQDYLLKPLSVTQVRDCLLQAQTMLNAPKVVDTVEGDSVSHVITVVGTRGGVGSSMVATSLAWLMSEHAERRTVLLDLDLHFGTVALTLDLAPGRGLVDAVENPSRIDALFIERAVVRASDNLGLLSAEAPLQEALGSPDGSAFYQLQEELQALYEVTIVDMPRHILVPFPHLASQANTIILVSDVTLASARDVIRILPWLKQNAPEAHILVVANKVQTVAGELSRKDFETSIEHKIDVAIPYDPKMLAQAAQLGTSYAEASGKDKRGKMWNLLMRNILDAVEGENDGQADKVNVKTENSFFERIGEIGTLLSGKGTK